MTAKVIQFPRRVIPTASPPANPFAVALAALQGCASLQAAMYGQAAQHWSAIAELYRAQRPDNGLPCDTEPVT